MEETPYSLILEDVESIVDYSVEELYHGPRRVVWLAVRDGRRIVYKGLPEQFRNHPEEIAALRKEFLLGLRIEHEGLVRIYGFEHHPQLGSVIVMEYVDGVTLEEYININDPHLNRSLKERKRIALDIGGTLMMIHQKGIFHRDLKPDNILIRKMDGAVKIIDFGHGDSEDFVIYKTSLGTSQYGAPEQQTPSRGGKECDVYSFGRILELLLPERSFKNIREACLHEQPSLRPDMDQVTRLLSRKRRFPATKRMVIGGTAAMVLMGLALWGVKTGQNDGSEVVWNADPDTLKNTTSAILGSNEREVRENQASKDVNEDVGLVSAPTPKIEVNLAGNPSDIIMGEKKIAGSVDDALDSLFRAVRLEIGEYHKEYYRKLVDFKGSEEDYQYKKGMLQIDRINDFMKISNEFMKGLSNFGLTQAQWIQENKKLQEIMDHEQKRIDQSVEEERRANH